MKKKMWLFSVVLLTAFINNAAANDASVPERGTKEEAVAMVQRAIDYYKSNGAAKAFAEFSKPKGKFVDRDLYIVVYDSQGVCLAHGILPKLVGRNLSDQQDVDGKYYVRERIELMKTHESFWTNYKFSDPLTHKLVSKSTYCKKQSDMVLKDIVFCSGVYDAQS